MNGDLGRITEELARFRAELLESDQDSIDILLERYASFRRCLSREYRRVAEARLLRGGTVIDDVRLRIQDAIRAADRGALPEKYLMVRRYGRTHTVLLEYLAGQLTRPVPASRLRVLTGDQIHTERRVRELRDLGLEISWKKVADDDQYVLEDLSLNMPRAVKCQLERSIRADRSIDTNRKKEALALVPSLLHQIRD